MKCGGGSCETRLLFLRDACSFPFTGQASQGRIFAWARHFSLVCTVEQACVVEQGLCLWSRTATTNSITDSLTHSFVQVSLRSRSHHWRVRVLYRTVVRACMFLPCLRACGTAWLMMCSFLRRGVELRCGRERRRVHSKQPVLRSADGSRHSGLMSERSRRCLSADTKSRIRATNIICQDSSGGTVVEVNFAPANCRRSPVFDPAGEIHPSFGTVPKLLGSCPHANENVSTTKAGVPVTPVVPQDLCLADAPIR